MGAVMKRQRGSESQNYLQITERCYFTCLLKLALFFGFSEKTSKVLVKKRVKHTLYRPGQALRFPGG
jgi:hypothetical protein